MATSKEIYQLDGPSLEGDENYRMLAGALQYLTLTRPYIAFTVNQICQFMHAPKVCHMEALKRILRYVKRTLNNGVQLYKSKSAFVSETNIEKNN